MNWKSSLRRKIAAPDGDAQLQRFLLDRAPTFKAPRNAAQWKRRIPQLQKQMIDEVMLRGWPTGAAAGKPYIKWGKVLEPHPDYRIRKLRYEVAPDYWIPALLYEPTQLKGKHPVALNPNGHHRGGKAATYKQARCINLAKRGVIALNFEFIGMSELENDAMHNHFAFFDLVGRAGVGLHYLNMKRALDVLLAHKHADRKRVAMTGLSGGGWQTIILSALDNRITVSVPVAGYMPVRARIGCLNDIGDHEQNPPDMLTVCDYDTLTAMLAPRPALLILNESDNCCFKTARTRPLIYDAVKPTYRAFNALGDFQTHNNVDPGTHNYEADNRGQLYRFLNRQFNLDTPDDDLPFEDELYSEHALRVGLPPEQKTAVQLAIDAAPKLPVPRTAARRRALRKRLAEVLHLPDYDSRLRRVAGDTGGGVWEARVGPWRLPVSYHQPQGAADATLWLNDGGRAAIATVPERAPRDRQLFAPDLLGAGELEADERHRMLIETVGERMLGIRVAQTLALARAVRKRAKVKRLTLRAQALASDVTALIAAALEPAMFDRVELSSCPATLLTLLHWRDPYPHCQAVLCFGLLEVADVPQLVALAEDVELTSAQRSAPPMRV